jgi:hypothetical protein
MSAQSVIDVIPAAILANPTFLYNHTSPTGNLPNPGWKAYLPTTPTQRGVEYLMAKRTVKTVIEETDDLDEIANDIEARELIIEQCMTDVSEILSGVYEEISTKVRTLVEDLADE